MGQEESQGRHQTTDQCVWTAVIAIADIQEREFAGKKIWNIVQLAKPDKEDIANQRDKRD